MRLQSILAEAWGALKFNRQRSILTMISLGWGVACFVILYSYGEGFDFALHYAFRAVGQDLIVMFNGSTSTQAGGERAGRKIRMDLADVDLIRADVPLVAAISPEVFLRRAQIQHEYRQEVLQVRGVRPPEYGRIRSMSIGTGRWLSAEDDSQKHQIAILGANAAKKLFGEVPPEGEAISINGMPFTCRPAY